MQISMRVNGTSYTADVEPRRLLVDYIREELGLTGTKVGCDTGQCGTCVIQANGKSTKSCSLLAIQLDGGTVQTIEGVSQHGQLNALQEALWEMHGLQCGFCTPGMVMSLLDLLQHDSDPSEEMIQSWLHGNLCRCTGYQSIVRAVRYAVEQAQKSSVAELATSEAK
jgi:aerobic carbon-monoxide dehydrogenase small subunit